MENDMEKYLAIIPLSALFWGCGPKGADSDLQEAWNTRNNPVAFNVSDYAFDALPREGFLPPTAYPWSDDYWATYAGGISKRWQIAPNSTNYKDFQYPLLSQDEVLNGTMPVAIKDLSPAEKYDLLLGRYDFPLTKSQREKQQEAVDETDKVPTWMGICHGWAPATLMEPEPGAKIVRANADGIEIPFFTSDINALMSQVYADYVDEEKRGNTVSVGERCKLKPHEVQKDELGRVVMSECRDTNPGSLHLILASWLGPENPAERRGFIADLTRTNEVWNQAVVGYKVIEAQRAPFNPTSDTLGKFRAAGTVELIRVKTEISYIAETAPHRTPLTRHEQYTKKIVLDYTLELDGTGKIVGGEWATENPPDFLWRMLSKPNPGGELLDYEIVSDLTRESRGE
jgi:hypothetical protein